MPRRIAAEQDTTADTAYWSETVKQPTVGNLMLEAHTRINLLRIPGFETCVVNDVPTAC